LRFLEQAALIRATAPAETADKLLEILREAFFVGYEDQRRETRRVEVGELLRMQDIAYKLTPTSGGGVLEMVAKGKK